MLLMKAFFLQSGKLITWIEEEETAAQTYLRLRDAANLIRKLEGGLLL